MRPRFPRIALAAVAGIAAPAVQAAHIDDIELRREGEHAVIAIRFDTEVQFERAIETRSSDLLVITYRLLTSTNREVRTPQGRRLGAAQGLPEIRIADEVDRGDRQRRLVVRFAGPVPNQARAGAGNRSIEIVLPGRGTTVRTTAAKPPVTPATLPDPERRFAIVVASNDKGGVELQRPIPRALQDYEVFTERRVEGGRTIHEIRVGYFATRAQAEGALRELGAFPQATIVALAPAPEAAPAPARAPAAATAPTPVFTPPLVTQAAPAPTPAPTAPAAPAAPAVAAVPVQPPPQTAEEIESRGASLLASARAALAQGNTNAALEALSALLDLPPNRSTPTGQELAGRARLAAGDTARARIEFETYLRLYPNGPAAADIRRELASLPAPAPVAAAPGERPAVETTTTGSASMYYYGGNGRIRSQDFQDSAVSGVPQVVGDPQLTSDKSSQLYNDVDLNWRRRDADSDLRFAFRDSYTTDLDNAEKSRNRLSALYLDYKTLTGPRYGARLGRQSPLGGGVMGRFDGLSGFFYAAPKVKLGAVAGQPSDKYFESRRRFYGASIDAEALLPNFGTALYAIEQKIDGVLDRRAVGLEARYFKGGISSFAQGDYDVVMKTWNIAAIQGTWILQDNTVFNALYDRRALQMVALGNALTFTDPNGTLYTKIADKLATTTIDALRDQVRRTTPFVTQAQLGVTKPVNANWQVGGSAQLTKVGAIPPVPDVPGFENGRPATGNIYSATAQLIGLNLYSPRDTHVFSLTALSTPAVKNVDGWLLAYNHSSVVWQSWQLEPSIQYYTAKEANNGSNERWTPGLRLTYRGFQRWAIETAVTYEIGKATRQVPDPSDPTLTLTTKEDTTRANYSLGARFEF